MVSNYNLPLFVALMAAANIVVGYAIALSLGWGPRKTSKLAKRGSPPPSAHSASPRSTLPAMTGNTLVLTSVLQEEAENESIANLPPAEQALPSPHEPNGEIAAVTDALSDFWDSAAQALATAELSSENQVPTADAPPPLPAAESAVAVGEIQQGNAMQPLVRPSLGAEENDDDTSNPACQLSPSAIRDPQSENSSLPPALAEHETGDGATDPAAVNTAGVETGTDTEPRQEVKALPLESSDIVTPSETVTDDDIEAAVLRSLAGQIDELTEIANSIEHQSPIPQYEGLSDDATNAVLKALAGIDELE